MTSACLIIWVRTLIWVTSRLNVLSKSFRKCKQLWLQLNKWPVTAWVWSFMTRVCRCCEPSGFGTAKQTSSCNNNGDVIATEIPQQVKSKNNHQSWVSAIYWKCKTFLNIFGQIWAHILTKVGRCCWILNLFCHYVLYFEAVVSFLSTIDLWQLKLQLAAIIFLVLVTPNAFFHTVKCQKPSLVYFMDTLALVWPIS